MDAFHRFSGMDDAQRNGIQIVNLVVGFTRIDGRRDDLSTVLIVRIEQHRVDAIFVFLSHHDFKLDAAIATLFEYIGEWTHDVRDIGCHVVGGIPSGNPGGHTILDLQDTGHAIELGLYQNLLFIEMDGETRLRFVQRFHLLHPLIEILPILVDPLVFLGQIIHLCQGPSQRRIRVCHLDVIVDLHRTGESWNAHGHQHLLHVVIGMIGDGGSDRTILQDLKNAHDGGEFRQLRIRQRMFGNVLDVRIILNLPSFLRFHQCLSCCLWIQRLQG